MSSLISLCIFILYVFEYIYIKLNFTTNYVVAILDLISPAKVYSSVNFLSLLYIKTNIKLNQIIASKKSLYVFEYIYIKINFTTTYIVVMLDLISLAKLYIVPL